MVAMQNGCICCTLREDLLVEVAKLAKENRFDYLLIETSGISEPMPVAETFTFEIPVVMDGKGKSNISVSVTDNDKKGGAASSSQEGTGVSLSDVARLDTMVTVIDAKSFHKDLNSIELLHERYGKEEVTEEDNRSVVNLLIDQVEFANVILINKIDLVSEEEVAQIEKLVHKLNPNAIIKRTKHSKVDLKDILNTGLFDFSKAASQTGWLKEMRGEHTPETEEYGINSFIYRRRRPFHPKRLFDLIEEGVLKNVVRSKGFFWLATRMDDSGEWSGAGEVYQFGYGGGWFADIPRDEWPDDDTMRAEIEKDMVPPFGDRRQEIVFIGIKMDCDEISKLLDSCLLTDEEMALGPNGWAKFEDPFEPWENEDEDENEEEEDDEYEDDEEEEDDDNDDEEEEEEEVKPVAKGKGKAPAKKSK
eukprot:GEZU01009580.1.p1 GENE.GEZU01009580.1~~GEZU01009580.1.p1  ORF type:complete len:419 (+),score=182.80 GEZU01009580.1:418-1674(+)